jgi:hypothetical protein
MSGTKRITVDQQAWQDVQQKAARLRDLERELPAVVEAVRRAQQEQADRDRAEMQSRSDELNRSMAQMSDLARQLEEGTTRRIRAASDLIMSEARASARKVRDETRQLLDEQEQRFEAELERERAERQQEFAGLRQDVAGLLNRGDRALAAATTQVADARVLHDAIAASLPHERYAPGRLAALGKRLAAAEANVAQGLGEAALAQVQDLHLNLGELRVDVELRDAEWRAAHLAAVSAVTALVEQIRYNSVIQVSDDEAGVAGELDVDFWSDGELAALKAEAEALAARVGSEQDPPSLAELRSVAERDAASLDQRLTDVVAKARTRQWASQIRVNLAEMVVDALEETTGYTWQGDATYAGEDQRSAFYSKLRHPDDSEIVVEVSPDESGDSCVLRILSYESGVPDESDRVRRAHAIADSLRERGLQTGAPAADPTPPDPAMTNFDQLRQARRAVTQRA